MASPPNRFSWSALVTALLAGTLLLGLAILLVVSGNPLGFAAAGVLLLFGGVAAHYVVWGWWLAPLIRAEVERQERERGDSSSG